MEYWISKQIGSRAFNTENTALAKANYAHAMPNAQTTSWRKEEADAPKAIEAHSKRNRPAAMGKTGRNGSAGNDIKCHDR